MSRLLWCMVWYFKHWVVEKEVNIYRVFFEVDVESFNERSLGKLIIVNIRIYIDIKMNFDCCIISRELQYTGRC